MKLLSVWKAKDTRSASGGSGMIGVFPRSYSDNLKVNGVVLSLEVIAGELANEFNDQCFGVTICDIV